MRKRPKHPKWIKTLKRKLRTTCKVNGSINWRGWHGAKEMIDLIIIFFTVIAFYTGYYMGNTKGREEGKKELIEHLYHEFDLPLEEQKKWAFS